MKGRGKGRKEPARTDLSSAPFPDLQGDAGMQHLVAFARDGFAERAPNGQRVLVGSSIALQTIGVQEML